LGVRTSVIPSSFAIRILSLSFYPYDPRFRKKFFIFSETLRLFFLCKGSNEHQTSDRTDAQEFESNGRKRRKESIMPIHPIIDPAAVEGDAPGGLGSGVRGRNSIGEAEGVLGGTDPVLFGPVGAYGMSKNQGVVGVSTGDGHGVLGRNNSTLNPANAPDGPLDLNIKAGVWGDNLGGGYGVRGTSIGPLGSIGVHGHGKGIGVEGFGADQGVLGQTTGSGVGVLGAGIKAGVQGNAGGPGLGHVGVLGRSGGLGALDPITTAAVTSETNALQTGGRGVLGIGVEVGVQAIATTGHGVDGFSVAGVGVAGGTSGNGPDSVGLFGIAQAGGASLAGKFLGNVDVQGNLSKSGGGFRIDHPLAPTERHLNHSFVESSERKNVYDGIAVLDAKGQASVELPAWFEALNGEFRYQLTSLHGFAPVYIGRKLSDNRFVIAGGIAGMEISWQVTGVRLDAWAQANPLYVEEDKHELERGHYRHVDVHTYNDEKADVLTSASSTRDRGLLYVEEVEVA
jgi:hypothetical protein